MSLEFPDTAVVVTSNPKELHQASPTKVVELRNLANEHGGRLALFIPAGQRMPAEDSFGGSTFELVDLTDLYELVVTHLFDELQVASSDAAEKAHELVDVIQKDNRHGVSAREVALYLALLIDSPHLESVGIKLHALGLLPDREVTNYSAQDLADRLTRNLQYLMLVATPGPPPERIRKLPIDRKSEAGKGIVSVIFAALSDGLSDRFEIAERLGLPAVDSVVDFANWTPVSAQPQIDELKIIDVIGDFNNASDREVRKKAKVSIGVKLSCRPAPRSVVGLKELSLEIVSLTEDRVGAKSGKEVLKRGKQLPAATASQWRMKVSIGEPNPELDPGIYRFRLSATDDNNVLLKSALSEPFKVPGDAEMIESIVETTLSIPAAQVSARARDEEFQLVAPEVSVAESNGEASKKLVKLNLHFPGTPGSFQLEIARILADIERESIDDPQSMGRYRVSLNSMDIQETLVGGPVPESFLDSRKWFFDQLKNHRVTVHGDEVPGALVATANLTALREPIEAYLASWIKVLQESNSQDELRTLLSIDQTSIGDCPGAPDIRLVSPLHPLRLGWLLKYQSHLEEWVRLSDTTEVESKELRDLLGRLYPINVPRLIPGDLGGVLRHVDSVDLYWSLYASPKQPETSAVASRVRAWLGMEGAPSAGLAVGDLVQRVRRYLIAHPYAELLVLNFVQPGAGRQIVDALMQLQSEPSTSHLRYVLRLFSDDLARIELGAALDYFMADPEGSRGVKKDAADAFLAAAEDSLSPKLTYSKHPVQQLLKEPQSYPAHVTFFLDWFDLTVVPVPCPTDRRSFFADALIVEPSLSYRRGDGIANPQWDEVVAAPVGAGTAFIGSYMAAENAIARMLGGQGETLVPAIRLDLDRVKRSVLDIVHKYSDWVVVFDRVFSDDYLDGPTQQNESPRYLIDYVTRGSIESGRRVMVSTRSRSELATLLRPVANEYDLVVDEGRVEVLLGALQALGAGLPLKLLNNRTQALEAFSLSLGTMFLVDQGELRHSLALPLDLHQDLFTVPEGVERVTDLKRTDLAVVRIELAERRFEVRLIELKARRDLPMVTPLALVEQISAQLENSKNVLRTRLFGTDIRKEPGSLSAGLQVRQLTRILTHYLDRAGRYGFIEPERTAPLHRFISSLDQRYSLSFSKHALIFDFTNDSQLPEQIGDVAVRRIGRHEIEDLVARTRTPLSTSPLAKGESELLRTVGRPAAEEVEQVTGLNLGPSMEDLEQGVSEEVEPVAPLHPLQLEEQPLHTEANPGPEAKDVLLVGTATNSRQFGVIGRILGTNRPVAIDVDGTNVISVFGVQGSGKSYTVGTLIEAALVPEPSLNRLQRPLAAVVFHYSNDKTYLPEFAAMVHPNDDPLAVDVLRSDYSSPVRGVATMRILVPEELVDERTKEFPGAEVRSLLLSPLELTLNDWKLLMGLESGEQMYSKSMNLLFRKLRGTLSLVTLERGIEDSPMSAQQKQIARTRLSFVERFVSDSGGVSEAVRPGSLVIVDMRDELIEQDEALAIFMVLLNRFAQVTSPDGRTFNKIIVFDEAHKYMNDARLTSAITQTVREMRHRGTTIVIASQNPPSVPREVIELSSVIIAHKFTSPQWLDHVRKVNTAFGDRDIKPSQLASLPPGEAFIWSAGGAVELRRPQKIRVRPRLTKHGGFTRQATSGE